MAVLSGYKFLEVANIGPTQFAGMLLADMGAEVIRVEQAISRGAGPSIPRRYNVMNRGRRSIAVDLKDDAGVETLLRLVERADALFEGFRPGVMERLGVGPETCMARNPALVYGRMTGWGQDGPLADTVGHDPNYIALSGALHSIGEAGKRPTIPLNLVGDFGGGALYLVTGLLAALLERGRSGRGQVVDAAMLDGAASLMTMFYGLAGAGLWSDERGSHLLDGGAPCLRTYRTKDDRFVAVGPLEPPFHAALADGLGLDPSESEDHLNPERWPALHTRLEEAFATRTRDEWAAHFAGTDACVSPVLSLGEAPRHPHNRARETFVELGGVVQPAPAPRFDRTPSAVRNPPQRSGADTREVLAEWGFTAEEIERLLAAGAIRQG